MVYFAGDSMLFLAHLAGLVATALVSAVAARRVSRRSDDRAGTVMVSPLSTRVVMASALTVQLLAPPLWAKSVLATVWYAFVLTNPVAFFLFAVYYTGRDRWLTPPVPGLLAASVPVVLGLLVTDPLTDLLVRSRRRRTARGACRPCQRGGPG